MSPADAAGPSSRSRLLRRFPLARNALEPAAHPLRVHAHQRHGSLVAMPDQPEEPGLEAVEPYVLIERTPDRSRLAEAPFVRHGCRPVAGRRVELQEQLAVEASPVCGR